MSDAELPTDLRRPCTHLAALLLRSSLTHPQMGSLRSSAQTHDLGHLDTESLVTLPTHAPSLPRRGPGLGCEASSGGGAAGEPAGGGAGPLHPGSPRGGAGGAPAPP